MEERVGEGAAGTPACGRATPALAPKAGCGEAVRRGWERSEAIEVGGGTAFGSTSSLPA